VHSMKFEETLFQVLEEVDQEEMWDITYTEERIEEIKEGGEKLRIFRERSEKETRKLKEKAMEEYIKNATKRMSLTWSYFFKEEYYKETQKKEEGKKTPDLDKKVTQAIIDIHLSKIENTRLNKLIQWEKFKKLGKKPNWQDLIRIVNRCFGREWKSLEKSEKSRKRNSSTS
jgi:hypothetical protein